jgi:hypothetical protein
MTDLDDRAATRARADRPGLGFDADDAVVADCLSTAESLAATAGPTQRDPTASPVSLPPAERWLDGPDPWGSRTRSSRRPPIRRRSPLCDVVEPMKKRL